MNEFIIIAHGPDRKGIVSDLSKIITNNDSNIKKSRMTKLSGDFAIIMLIETTKTIINLEQALSVFNLSITIKKATKTIKKTNEYLKKIIQLNGADNEGLVYSLTNFLSKNNINIQNLTTEIIQAPITGINLFSMKAIIHIPKKIAFEIILEKIDALKNNLNVEIEIIDI